MNQPKKGQTPLEDELSLFADYINKHIKKFK